MSPEQQKLNFVEKEKKILEFWEANCVFERSVEGRKKGKRFVFYEGPPTANGMPHIGHALTRAFKDIILRYKTMRGFYVLRRAGWDTHGLPVEIEVEKELGFKAKQDIERYGIAEFNKKAKESVWRYKTEWEKFTKRIGFWVDFNNPYITYDTSYIETLWRIIKEFWNKKLLYEDFRVTPWCTRCGTGLSSHELAQGYKEVEDTAVYVKFKIKSQKDTYILSWTTTPWTLPGNIALAVGDGIMYQVVSSKGKRDKYILAKDFAQKLLNTEYIIHNTILGKNLVGLEYESFFDVPQLKSKKSYRIYPADFVAAEEGTGVVHTAVMYGEDDYALGNSVGLPKFHTVDESGRFIKELKGIGGMYVKSKETEEKIIAFLVEKKALFAPPEKYRHDYPFCWRCQMPLLYYARKSWWVRVSHFRKELLRNNSTVNWIPEHIKNGRFGEFLKEARDWAFSRERYWGTPLPVWRCDTCKRIEVIGSVAELKKVAKKLPYDETGKVNVHRPYIDDITFFCGKKCGGKMVRVSEVVDGWFDSGSMPFASAASSFQLPATSQKKKRFSYPADFICEAVDQTRGWFYTLLVVATLLKKKSPYKNVISLGHVLDKNGQKMSKSKGNVVDPNAVMEQYGADALRWYFYTINSAGEPKRFDEKDVQGKLRSFLMTFWNSFVFFNTYVDKIRNQEILKLQNILDDWVMAKLNNLISGVTRQLDMYDIIGAARLIEDFTISDFSQWYLRRSRRRFQHPETNQEKEEAAAVTAYILLMLCKLTAPFTPFLSEEIYQKLRKKMSLKETSIHLVSWPSTRHGILNSSVKNLLKNMELAREIVAHALKLRAEAGIKVRQPLSKLQITNYKLQKELLELIKEEVNIKEITFGKKLELDTIITPKLKEEGMVREVIRNLQEMRRDAGLKPNNKIRVQFSTEKEMITLLGGWEEKIKATAGATHIVVGGKKQFKIERELNMDGKSLWIGIG